VLACDALETSSLVGTFESSGVNQIATVPALPAPRAAMGGDIIPGLRGGMMALPRTAITSTLLRPDRGGFSVLPLLSADE
jgi:hypothetical protein